MKSLSDMSWLKGNEMEWSNKRHENIKEWMTRVKSMKSAGTQWKKITMTWTWHQTKRHEMEWFKDKSKWHAAQRNEIQRNEMKWKRDAAERQWK